jgi:Na+-driven multidrug efflux pump
MRPVAMWLGAEGQMLEDCVVYGRILLAGNTFFMLQYLFQTFLITAEKPNLGLGFTIAAGVTNMVLDLLFVGILHWGVAGAAWATILSQAVGGIGPLLYFARKNTSLLRLTKTKWDSRVLLRTCTNGSSELMSNISASVVTILYNAQLMRLAGENGVAAYGVLMYVNFIFIAIFIGYAMGSAPVVGFHFGAQNHPELKSLLRKSVVILFVFGTVLTLLAFGLAAPLSKIFVGYDQLLYDMTLRGFLIYAVSFLLCGFNIFGSSFFTALNNGLVSAIIAFLRTLVFQVLAICTLPWIFGLDGVWFAIILAELLALFVVVFFIFFKRKQYHYM